MSRDLAALEEPVRKRALQLIDLAKARLGVELLVTSTLRSYEEQERLFKIGRRDVPGEKIVTRARPGQSWHNHGLAFDVIPLIDGKAVWNSPLWEQIGMIGEELDLQWGGNWTTFKDRPHFEYHPHLDLVGAQARQKKQQPYFTPHELAEYA